MINFTDSIDLNNVSEVKRLIIYAKAKHISNRVLTVLSDYYESSDVDISKEYGLPEQITTEIEICLSSLNNI